MEGVVACPERLPVIALTNNNSEPEVETAVIVEEFANAMKVSVLHHLNSEMDWFAWCKAIEENYRSKGIFQSVIGTYLSPGHTNSFSSKKPRK